MLQDVKLHPDMTSGLNIIKLSTKVQYVDANFAQLHVLVL